MPTPSDNPYQSPESSPSVSSSPRHPANYSDVKWYRRSGFVSLLVVVGFFCFPPFLWAACIVLVTGDVYYDKRRDDFRLKTWSVANKMVAWLVLVWHSYLVYGMIMKQVGT